MRVETACEGKVRHDSAQQANKSIRAMTRRHSLAKKLVAYKCPYCHFWHIGGKRTLHDA